MWNYTGRLLAWCGALIVGTFLVGCESTAPMVDAHEERLRNDLEQARAQWNASGVTEYVYVYGGWGRTEFEELNYGHGRIEVSDEVTIAAGRAEPPSDEESDRFFVPSDRGGYSTPDDTMESLFDLIDERFEPMPRPRVTVTYDQELGYPSRYEERDEEGFTGGFTFFVTCLTPAPYTADDCHDPTSDGDTGDDDAGTE